VNDVNVPPLLVLPSKEILTDDPSLEKAALDNDGAGQDSDGLSTVISPIDEFCWKMLLAKLNLYLDDMMPDNATVTTYLAPILLDQEALYVVAKLFKERVAGTNLLSFIIDKEITFDALNNSHTCKVALMGDSGSVDIANVSKFTTS
jgi:hypothetical protein